MISSRSARASKSHRSACATSERTYSGFRILSPGSCDRRVLIQDAFSRLLSPPCVEFVTFLYDIAGGFEEFLRNCSPLAAVAVSASFGVCCHIIRRTNIICLLVQSCHYIVLRHCSLNVFQLLDLSPSMLSACVGGVWLAVILNVSVVRLLTPCLKGLYYWQSQGVRKTTNNFNVQQLDRDVV